jgi:hypothetical protein
MSNKKDGRGRPRKYSTNAERQKAYYERKKQRMKELEEKLTKLEGRSETEQKKITRKKADIHVESFPWKKITPGEITLIGKKELEKLIANFKEKIYENSALIDSILNLIITTLDIDYSGSINDLSSKDLLELNSEVNTIIKLSQESNQQQTFLYLLEAELASRDRSIERELKLDILEKDKEELLKERKKVEKSDEIKITRSK